MTKIDPREILKKPYARCLTPDECGGYVATIQEFSGCIAEGDSAELAMQNLEAAAASWLKAAAEFGQPIPDPLDLHGYSGKVALRIPRGLHKQAAEIAASEGASLNQFLTSAIAQAVGRKAERKAVLGELCGQLKDWFIGGYAVSFLPTTLFAINPSTTAMLMGGAPLTKPAQNYLHSPAKDVQQ
ncbi:MAG: toxin-antitoxin system HicB family antitoxin [Thermaerobacter sp.]|nr:toxin-antitoxin system HicB family antitoxin [Thermaerobacter sp.]